MTRRHWIGIDGEGVGRMPHRYVLLSASDAAGVSYSVEDRGGLSSRACFEFLLALPKTARVCGYYLSYDWTMMLSDLPDPSIYRLLRPELRALPDGEGGGFSEVRWKGYRLHWLAGMMRVGKGSRSVTVWDLGKYYQAPFVDSLDTWQIPDVDTAEMRRMKGERERFTLRDLPAIRRYNLEECQALARLATELESAHEAIGLRPPVWHGPGSTAACALKSMGVQEKRGDPPPEVCDAADRAFFGGRFEQRAIGTFDGVHARDIASAYPYHAYFLPCLEHGRWTRVTRESRMVGARQALVRFRIRDTGRVPWAPLPVRLPTGSIVFPTAGATGWTYLEEWLAARAGWDGLEFLEAWTLRSDCDCQPFSPILDWYRERVRIGKSGRGRILKLLLNSIYGKTAQSIGKPQYASRLWAGMITSGTRAQLLRAMRAHSSLDAVVAVATDGIYALEGANLEPSRLAPDTLGAWEHEPHGRMTFVRPGIYWAHDDDTLRARGIGRKKLTEQRAAVLAAIERGDSGRVSLGTSTLFGAARMCVYRTREGEYRRSHRYGEWIESPARVSLDPGPKRLPDWSPPRYDAPVESAPYRSNSADNVKKALLDELFDAIRG